MIAFLQEPAVAGMIGSSVGFIVGYPFDVMKSYSQLEQTKNMFHSAKLINERFGFKGFYNGIMTPLLCRSAVKGSLFGVQAACMNSSLFSKIQDRGSANYAKMAVAGFVGACVSSLINSPVELIKLSYQRGVPFWHNFGAPGFFRGLFLGLPETIYRDGPFFALYFPLYYWLKEKDVPFAGGIAGSIPWILTFPMDVVKTHKQNPDMNHLSFREFYKLHGFRSLSNGLVPCIARAFPTHYTAWVVIDFLTNFGKDKKQY
jgi:solute carrier family 25 (mitochondrial carnitine/acylcarnitine transporter), member 20/29